MSQNSFQIQTTDGTSGAGTAYPPATLEFTPCFSGVRVTRPLVLCVCFVDHCLSFFFWALCYLFFFDLRIMITPLVSSTHLSSLENLVITFIIFFNILTTVIPTLDSIIIFIARSMTHILIRTYTSSYIMSLYTQGTVEN